MQYKRRSPHPPSSSDGPPSPLEKANLATANIRYSDIVAQLAYCAYRIYGTSFVLLIHRRQATVPLPRWGRLNGWAINL